MTDTTQDELGQSGISRRRALQAGIGAGIGAVAWSGATITSMGGTPAYAVTCTFAVNVFLANNRNTSKGCAQTDDNSIEYHPLDLGLLPSGYSISPNIVQSPKFCNDGARFTSTLTFPAGMTCRVHTRLHRSTGGSPEAYNNTGYFDWYSPTAAGESDGSLVFTLPQADDYNAADPIPSDTRYTVVLECWTTGLQGCP